MLKILQNLGFKRRPVSMFMDTHSELDYGCALFICRNRENPRQYVEELQSRGAISQTVAERLRVTL